MQGALASFPAAHGIGYSVIIQYCFFGLGRPGRPISSHRQSSYTGALDPDRGHGNRATINSVSVHSSRCKLKEKEPLSGSNNWFTKHDKNKIDELGSLDFYEPSGPQSVGVVPKLHN